MNYLVEGDEPQGYREASFCAKCFFFKGFFNPGTQEATYYCVRDGQYRVDEFNICDNFKSHVHIGGVGGQ